MLIKNSNLVNKKLFVGLLIDYA